MEDGTPIGHDDATNRDIISVAGALKATRETMVVQGFIVDSGGVVTISDVLAESYPPQPGGAWLRIQNPEQLDLADTKSFNDTVWTPTAIRITGRCIDETFVLEPDVEIDDWRI